MNPSGNTPRNSASEQFSLWLIQNILKFRWLIIIACVLLALGLASGGRFIVFSNDYRYFFSDENPQLKEFDTLQKIFTKNDNVLIVMEDNNQDVFTPEFLKLIQNVTREAWLTPFSSRVDSITNFQHTFAEGDDLIVMDLIPEDSEYTPEGLQTKKQIALEEPLLLHRLINQTATVTAVNITFELPGKDVQEATEVVNSVRGMISRMKQDYPEVNFYLTGMVPMSNAFFEATLSDMQSIVPLMYLGIVVIMYLLLRSIGGTIATLLVISFSTLSAMGLVGWLGIKLTPSSATAPTMIMTLAIADSIHILVTILALMRAGHSKHDALSESFRQNLGPVFLTSLTTAIGFLSMNFSDAPPFRDLGNITSMGVVLAFVYSVLFLPAFISVIPIKVKTGHSNRERWMERLAEWVIRHNRKCLILIGSLSVISVAAIFMNELNDEFVKYFDKSIAFRRDTDFVLENLTGVYQIEYALDSGESGGISEPEFLNHVERFCQWWYQQEEVLHVSTLTDVFKRLNKSLHGDDPSWYKIPENREMASQFLLLYEMSLPYGLDLNNQINVDKSKTRLVITLGDVSSKRLRELTVLGEEWLRLNASPSMQCHGVGPSVMFSYISERNIKSMLTGTTIALFLISLSLILALRDLRTGLISLVPNLIPAIIAFGIWGIVIGKIGVALSIVTAMTLGIVVDDTVHFLSKYLRAKREKKLSEGEAIIYAFKSVGVAMATTSLILIVGFGILSFSAFELNSGMGKLTAITIGIALLADVFLLPPILLMQKRFQS